jgi:uncharacterized protein (UPF0303 family)
MEASAALEEDIRRLAEQERVLQLRQFGPEEAWMLGNIVREGAMAQGAPIAIDISFRDRVLSIGRCPAAAPTTPSGSGGSALNAKITMDASLAH